MKIPVGRLLTGGGIALVCLFVSVTVNILLTVQLQRVRAAPRSRLAALPAGVLPEVELTAHTGARSVFEYGQGKLPVLFYWFSPSCGWCGRNLPNFEALAAQSGGKYRFLPVSTASRDDLAAYALAHHLSFPLYSVSAESAARYGFRGTPTTLLVSPQGVAVEHWVGAYTGGALAKVERVLGVNLPGVARPETHR